MKKIYALAIGIFAFIQVGFSNYIHKFETSEGLTKVLIKADTVNMFFLNPTKFGFIGSDNKVVFELECEYVSNFHNGVAKVKKNGMFGFINKKGEFIIQPKYKTVGDFAEGLVAVGDSIAQIDKIVDINNNIVGTFAKYAII